MFKFSHFHVHSVTAHKNQFGKLVAQARERMQKSKNKAQKMESPSGQTESSQETTSTENTSASQDDAMTKDSASPKDSSAQEIKCDDDDVVVLEDGSTEDVRVEQQQSVEDVSTDDKEDTDEERERRNHLISVGDSREKENQASESQESEMDTSEGSLQFKSGRCLFKICLMVCRNRNILTVDG